MKIWAQRDKPEYTYKDVIGVSCPRCHEPRGEPCRGVESGKKKPRPHLDRYALYRRLKKDD